MKSEKKVENKKSVLSAILESMKKTGGCCGSDDSCGCSPSPKETDKNKGCKNADKK